MDIKETEAEKANRMLDEAREKVGAEIRGRMVRNLNAARRKQALRLLGKGEDPFIVAAWLRVRFVEVANLANEILEARGISGRIPTDEREYLEACVKLMKERAKSEDR